MGLSRGGRAAAGAILLLALAAACGESPPTEAEVVRARQKAEAAAAQLMRTLFAELTTALGQGPPERAMAVCADSAQELTEEVSRSRGVTVRRTSLRCRNPRNAPDDYERAWMEQAIREGATSVARAEVVKSGGRYELRYLRPIRLAEMCLPCHGTPDRIPPAVRTALEERYPEDEAVGFSPGDLRGVVSVLVPIE